MKPFVSVFLIPVIIATVFWGCISAPAETTVESLESETPLESGINPDYMDTTVRPQDDFYRFVNGIWLDETDIPADRVRWGSFDELRENAEEKVLAIVKEAAGTDAEHGSDSQKIGDLFNAFMDTTRIESAGLTPLEPEMDMIDGLTSHDDLPALWGKLQAHRITLPVNVRVGQDPRQSDVYITLAGQSGLGLPDRDYYLDDSERNQTLRNQYKDYIRTVWDLAGWENGDEAAETILSIETGIAEAHWSRIQNRDRIATYNKMSIDELAELAPGFDWHLFLKNADLGHIDEIVVRQPDYFTALAGLHSEISIDNWKNYLRYHLVRVNSGFLSSDFDDANFEFYGRILSGQEEQRSREKRASGNVESVLGFMVGQKYVERHFPQEASDRMDEMIDNLMIAFEASIKELEWMGDDTKKEALAKLATFNTKIGYPDKWRDYDCVSISRDDLVGNMRNSSVCEYERNIGRLGQEVDRDEWFMTPQTVNAYYSSTMNEIVFPAGILQPPFFNVDAEDAVNYGGIGAVIGHEISHGFDDQGRRSDGEGNLRDWWTEEDEEQFNKLAQKMVEIYSSFNPIDDLYLQGELGLGENIADLGGMNVAYRAYLNSLDGEEPPVIDGFTGEQRLFMGWAQIWRIKFRDEAMRQQVITGPHSPGRYRVIGILSNMPEFYEAFDVEPGDEMYRDEDERVRIW